MGMMGKPKLPLRTIPWRNTHRAWAPTHPQGWKEQIQSPRSGETSPNSQAGQVGVESTRSELSGFLLLSHTGWMVLEGGGTPSPPTFNLKAGD